MSACIHSYIVTAFQFQLHTSLYCIICSQLEMKNEQANRTLNEEELDAELRELIGEDLPSDSLAESKTYDDLVLEIEEFM